MLDELRQKPHGVKEAYAFWGAFVCTAIVAAIWMVSVSVRFSETLPSALPAPETQTAGAISQFFGQVKAGIADAWKQNYPEIAEVATTTVATSTRAVPPAVSSSTTSLPLIGTSSPRYIEIATTTRQ